jgi:predicted nucleotidyltransferase
LTPEAVIAALHTHAAELRQSGIHNAGLSGSRAARRIRTPTSTVWRSWTRGGRIGRLRLVGLERRLTELLGRNVGLLPEPIEQPRLRTNVDRDRRGAV